MSKRKRSKRKGYTNPAGLYITPYQEGKLKDALRRYNRKISSLSKYHPGVLPNKYDLSILDKFTSKSSLTSFINDLNKFADTKFKLVTTPSGDQISQAELDMIKDQLQRENRRRSKLRKLTQEQQEQIGFFKTDMDKVLRPIDIEKYKSAETLRKAAQKYSLDHTYQLAFSWKERYLNQIDYNINMAIIAGFDPAGDVISKMMRIKEYVEGLDNVNDITLAAYGSPAMDITVTSDVIYMQESIDEIYEAWDDFVSSL